MEPHNFLVVYSLATGHRAHICRENIYFSLFLPMKASKMALSATLH